MSQLTLKCFESCGHKKAAAAKILTETKDVFQKSEPRPAGPRVFDEKHLLCAHYLGFECSGWIVLTKSEILIMMEWSGC